MPIPQRDTNRYLTVKWSDVGLYCTSEQMLQLDQILRTIRAGRESAGKPTRNFVCVSDKNRALHDEVWGMVLAEVHNVQQEIRQDARARFAELAQRIRADAAVNAGQVSPTRRSRQVSWTGTISSSSRSSSDTVAMVADDAEPAVYNADAEEFFAAVEAAERVRQEQDEEESSEPVRPVRMSRNRVDLNTSEISYNTAWGFHGGTAR